MTVCANCGTKEGPFSRALGLGPLCAPSPRGAVPQGMKDPRIAECNRRRAKADNEVAS